MAADHMPVPARIEPALLRLALVREQGGTDTCEPPPEERVEPLVGDAFFELRVDADGACSFVPFHAQDACVSANAGGGLAVREAEESSTRGDPDLDAALVSQLQRTLARGADRSCYAVVLPEAIRAAFPDPFRGSDPIPVESEMRCLRGNAGDAFLRIRGTLKCVDASKVVESALRESEGEYRALVEQVSDGILLMQPGGRLLAVNRAAVDLFGMNETALRATPFAELFHPQDRDEDPDDLRHLASGRTVRSVRRLKRRGVKGWVWLELSARMLNDGRVQATARDISDRVQAEQRIRHLAYYDSLTALPNRERFREQIEAALDRAKRSQRLLALLFLDVDRFKQVNDSMGHSMGDELLVQVADRLRSAVRGGDSVARAAGQHGESTSTAEPIDAGLESPISRLGGDEFTILLQDLDHAQDAARVARRVLHILSRPFIMGDREIFVSASIGIAVWPEDGACAEVLLSSADTAMYDAKNRGGNAYAYYSTSMNVASARRLMLESALRHARDRGELNLLYQPIRDTRTGRVSAAEALLRWTDAHGQSIGPDEFIPVAEETGMIVSIGEWVLRTACVQAAAWNAEGFEPIRISVNVSAAQLQDLGFINVVEQALVDSGLPAEQLELEITETSILDQSPTIVDAVFALTEMGVSFALDDFGTGYSSLSALQRFPIDRIKIDRSFVSGMGERESDEALTSAIVAFARRLDQRVVAEGVETETQARMLVELGCQELQGYLFGRPESAEGFERYLDPAKPASLAHPKGSG